MQYLLTQAEYDALKSERFDERTRGEGKLLAVCTKAAEEIPMTKKVLGEDHTRPWGCILSSKRKAPFCDECPVLAHCPHRQKTHSR